MVGIAWGTPYHVITEGSPWSPGEPVEAELGIAELGIATNGAIGRY